MYHSEKNFFPTLHKIESGLFLSGYFPKKLNRENSCYPESEILLRLVRFTKKLTSFISHFWVLREATEASSIYKILKGVTEQLP